jgi:hypothetical protein
MNSGFERFISRAKAPLAAVLVLFLFLAQVAAVSGALHSEFHTDSTDETHECAATLLSKGQVDAAEPGLPALSGVLFAELILRTAGPVIDLPFLRLSSSRGPPSLG